MSTSDRDGDSCESYYDILNTDVAADTCGAFDTDEFNATI
jgi:hypothetical protein